MKKLSILFGTFILISTIIISGCVDEYEVSPPPKGTSPPSTPTPVPTVSTKVDPIELLSEPTWTWSSRIRIKDVDISDDGSILGGLSTQKAIVKTPEKTMFANIVWKNANFIDISDSGKYIGIADIDFAKLFNADGDELFSYGTNGDINHIEVLDSGTLIQGGLVTPQLSAVDVDGVEIWRWNPGISTAKTLDFDISSTTGNIVVGTQDDRVYYLSDTARYIWFQDVSDDIVDIEMADNGDVFFVLTADDRIYSYDKYGVKKWERELDVNTNKIDISKNGEYIITRPDNAKGSPSFKYKIYLLDKQGKVKWMKQMDSEVGVVGISDDAQYVFISEGRELKMFDNPEGNELAAYHLESDFGSKFTSLAMVPNAGKVVVGTTNSLLVFG